VWLVLTVSSLVVVLIPVLALAVMWLTNDRKLMGEHKNHWLTNVILSLLVCTALYFTWTSARDVWTKVVAMF
jgi:Mn2+/Fe2+ NRAMP family transporter